MILETFRPNSFQCLFKTRLKWFKWEERFPKRHCSGAGTEWQSRFYQLRTYPQHRTFITFSAKQTVLSLKKTPQSLSKYSGVGTIECAAKWLNLTFDLVFIIPLQKILFWHLRFHSNVALTCCWNKKLVFKILFLLLSVKYFSWSHPSQVFIECNIAIITIIAIIERLNLSSNQKASTFGPSDVKYTILMPINCFSLFSLIRNTWSFCV